ncbi:MAG: type 4a pilus biogenesis protein PilO [Desulfamplus sp.]|nr:type 4a pilus biogenesis protein PilO [Desulfamplus sp.]MBF0413602.1 type 4a pilus biogenesis protein PilO [Desulfamplus sp.]
MKKDKVKQPQEKKPFGSQMKEKAAPFFEKVGGLSKVHRIIISILTFSIMIGGYFYFIVLPRWDNIASLEKKSEELKQQLATYRKKAARLEEFRRKKKEKEDEFYKALAALPDAKEIPSLLTAVSKSGSDSGLEFLLFKPEPEVLKDFYAEIPVSINVKGGYHQIAQFFDRVSQLSRIVNIKDIVINYDKDGGLLTASCKAITYRFVEKSEIEKVAEEKGNKKKGRGGKK